MNRFLASPFSDPATEGGLDGPSITSRLPEGETYVAPCNTHIFAAVGEGSIDRTHTISPAIFRLLRLSRKDRIAELGESPYRA